jgi:mRNA interferase MazF
LTPLRRDVYWADIGSGRKPWLVISNNRRNRNLDSVIAVRITTTARDLPTWVPLTPADPMVGSANTDDIEQVDKDYLDEYAGSLTPDTMERVSEALRFALALI